MCACVAQSLPYLPWAALVHTFFSGTLRETVQMHITKQSLPQLRPGWLPVFHGSLKKFLSLFILYVMQSSHMFPPATFSGVHPIHYWITRVTAHGIPLTLYVYYTEVMRVATCPTVGCYCSACDWLLLPCPHHPEDVYVHCSLCGRVYPLSGTLCSLQQEVIHLPQVQKSKNRFSCPNI